MKKENKQPPGNQIILLLATGLGIGRIPLAPGTLGSLLGLLWFAALLLTGSFLLLFAGTVAGIFLAIWISGRAEQILKQRDPESIVIDEIVAVPLCFLSWAVMHLLQAGEMPGTAYFFSGSNAFLALGVFFAFRIFDIAKPWLIRRSQELPGGWGVVIDDVLAALYVNVLAIVIYGIGLMTGYGGSFHG